MNGQLMPAPPNPETQKMIEKNRETVDKIMELFKGKTLEEIGIIITEINKRIPRTAKI